MTPSEQYVYDLCRRSFLSLWSYANPRGRKADKELCDALVVCDPDVVIFSVKEIAYVEGEDLRVANERWKKRAIDKSAQQIYGAERAIRDALHVTTSSGSTGLQFPPPDRCKIHRVAVALGGQGKVSMHFGDLGKGFVHVFDEQSLAAVMGELDTVTDFVHYLEEKERLFVAGTTIMFMGGEEDLLALYLHNGRSFDTAADLIVVGDDLWSGFQDRPEVSARREANSVSLSWDRTIEWIIESEGAPGDALADPRTDGEMAIRVMARESRFERRLLGRSLTEFLRLGLDGRVRSRIAVSKSGAGYVFLMSPEDRRSRTAELTARCWVARGLNPAHNPIIGLAFDRSRRPELDICYLEIPDWGHEHQNTMAKIQNEFGYFERPQLTKVHEDEYPAGDAQNESGTGA